METNLILQLSIVSLITIVILYFIIKSAIKAAVKEELLHILKEARDSNRTSKRIQILQLQKQGISFEELRSIDQTDENTFWQIVKHSRSAEEKAAYEKEVEKIKSYQKE